MKGDIVREKKTANGGQEEIAGEGHSISDRNWGREKTQKNERI